MARQYVLRFSRLLLGLFLSGIGITMCINANIGLSPWNAFHQGFAYVFSTSIGFMTVLCSFLFIMLDFVIGEPVGLGSLINALLVGTFVDVIIFWDIIPMMDTLWGGIIMLLLGLVIISIASFLYIGSGLGCGPRDSLMVFLCRQFSNTPVGIVRGCMEGTALFIGWLLGAKIGIGTVIYVFGFGIMIQLFFGLFRFKVTEVYHETAQETIANFRRGEIVHTR